MPRISTASRLIRRGSLAARGQGHPADVTLSGAGLARDRSREPGIVTPWADRQAGRSGRSQPAASRRDGPVDALDEPVHARLAVVAGGVRELVEVGLLELLAGGQDLLAGVVDDRSGEDVEAPELTGQHLGQGVLDELDVLGRQVGDARLRRLAVHEAEEAHGLGVGVEVLVAGRVGAVLDLLGDARVLRAPDPVGRGQAGVDLAGAGVVVGHAPLALLLGDVGHGRRVGAGEDDLGAGVEERRRRLLLDDRVVPGVDPADVHGALGAGHLGAAHDGVAQADLLGDGEGRHVADLLVAVELRARAGEHAGQVLEVLHGAEEVAEVLAVRLVAGQVQEGLVRELLGDRGHGIHVAEAGADDEVEALARQAPEDLLGAGALGHELDVGDVAVGHVLAEVLEALVVGLAPAAVVVGPDEDHGDVELAVLDVGDLELRALGGGRADARAVGAAPSLGAGEPPVVEQALKTRANVPRSAASVSRLDAMGDPPPRPCRHRYASVAAARMPIRHLGRLLTREHPHGLGRTGAMRTGPGPFDEPKSSRSAMPPDGPFGPACPGTMPWPERPACARRVSAAARFRYHPRDVRAHRPARRAAGDHRPSAGRPLPLRGGLRPGWLARRDP